MIAFYFFYTGHHYHCLNVLCSLMQEKWFYVVGMRRINIYFLQADGKLMILRKNGTNIL